VLPQRGQYETRLSTVVPQLAHCFLKWPPQFGHTAYLRSILAPHRGQGDLPSLIKKNSETRILTPFASIFKDNNSDCRRESVSSYGSSVEIRKRMSRYARVQIATPTSRIRGNGQYLEDVPLHVGIATRGLSPPLSLLELGILNICYMILPVPQSVGSTIYPERCSVHPSETF
jgi:hypothetical protein